MARDPFVILAPLGLFAAILIAGLILRRILFRIIRAWSEATESHLAALMRETLRGPSVLWAIILAAHIAAQNSGLPSRWQHYIPPALEVLWVWSLTVAVSRFAGRAVQHYGRTTGTQSVTSLTQKVAQLVVVAIGVVWVLKVVFDISLTPILTTLGVGGLAVALALQDTLSNLFAGFYVSISGLVRVGDYIKLNTGEEGYISDINWRCTLMRTTANNLVVIPNNKLGQANFTNYYLPEPRMGMSVSISVGYGSDVDRVEAILLDETTRAAESVVGLLNDPPPTIRFNPGPADWALIYQVNFNVGQFADQYKVQSELRKLLFKRLQREGVSMPFPTHSVILEKPGS